MTHRLAKTTIILTTFATLVSAATTAHAQAWVGDKGSLDLSLNYNLGVSSEVVATEDLEFPDGGMTVHEFSLGAEYVPIPKLAVSVTLPLALIRYTGDKVMYPHAGGGTYDDGDVHATLTDLRVGTRYQVLDEPFALSPHLAVSVPVADYESIGNAVAGRHLKALHLGLSAGRLIGEATYVHLSYEFSLVEKYDRTAETAQHSQNRSDIALSVGHRLLDHRLGLNIGANLRETHGGVNFVDFPTLTPNEQLYHDAILDEGAILVGAGADYQVTNSVSVSLAARFFATGSNTQAASVLALGVAWSPL